MAKKNRLPYDRRGSFITLRIDMLNSEAFRSLTATQQALIPLLQIHWRNDRPVSYGVREAAAKLHCSNGTASKAFEVLREKGFIVLAEESLFNSQRHSRSRAWRLTWLPYQDRFPTNNWAASTNEELTSPLGKNKTSVSK